MWKKGSAEQLAWLTRRNVEEILFALAPADPADLPRAPAVVYGPDDQLQHRYMAMLQEPGLIDDPQGSPRAS